MRSSHKLAIFSWSMYDFANSAFTTLVVTFIYATYFVKAIAPDEIIGTTLWSRAISITAIAVAILSPIMGAIADRGGYRKLFLFIFTAIAVIASAVLYWVHPGQMTKALIWFTIGNIAFEIGGVFYNAFLPDIAPKDKIGRISGYGWSLGYIGGLGAMFLAMILFVTPAKPAFNQVKTSPAPEQGEAPEWVAMTKGEISVETGYQIFDYKGVQYEVRGVSLDDNGNTNGVKVLSESGETTVFSLNNLEQMNGVVEKDILKQSYAVGNNIRVTNLLVAFWFALFSIPIFLFLREDKSAISPKGSPIIHQSFKQLYKTFHEIKHYKQIVRFLIARLMYNDGLVTIFAFGGIYAAGTFGFSFDEIMLFGIVLNITAGFGAFVMGFMDDRWGGKRTVQISIWALSFATILAVLAPTKSLFWVAGILVGIFSGPNQAASRSMLGRFVPSEKENEFYGFYAFSGKATAFMGPLLLGILTSMFNTQRAGVAIVLVFFVIGGLLLRSVDEEEGIRVAGRDDKIFF